MDKHQLQIIVGKALEQLVKNDRYLIEHDVHEQSISSKLAYYMSSLIPPRFNAITGISNHLLTHLQQSLERAKENIVQEGNK